MIDQAGGGFRHAPGAARRKHTRRLPENAAAIGATWTLPAHAGAAGSSALGARTSRDGCFTGYEVLAGAVGATQAQKTVAQNDALKKGVRHRTVSPAAPLCLSHLLRFSYFMISKAR